MARKQMGMFDEGLLRRIDGARGDVPRRAWVQRVLEAALEGLDAASVATRPSASPRASTKPPAGRVHHPRCDCPICRAS